MAAKNLLISRSLPFGRNYSLRCLLMPLHVSSIHATYLLVSRFDISSFCPGVKTFCFSQKKTCLFLSYEPCSTVPVAALNTVNHRCPFKYRMHEFEIEQVPIYTSHREKLKRKIAEKWSLDYDLSQSREKHTFKT